MSIGIAIITCDRLNMFETCVQSIIKTHSQCIEELIVVNDGTDIVQECSDFTLINNKTNLGVGESKNVALKALMERDVEHLFIFEDDVEVISNLACKKYLQIADRSGVKHLNFCLHGDANKNGTTAAPKLIIDYNDIRMALYHNITGAMSYYHADTIKQCGYMDDQYRNAMEHVDHTMRIINEGYHPPFRWFADVENSDDLIRDQDPELKDSKIRNDQQWKDNFVHGVKRFHELYDINVCSPSQPCASQQQVIEFLKSLRNEN